MMWNRTKRIREPIQWQPFWIEFHVKLEVILIAVGLVGTEDEWKCVLANRDSPPDPNADIERYPWIRCTTLLKESPLSTALIFWKPWNVHTIDYQVNFRLPSVQSPHFTLAPWFFFERKGHEYVFGLTVNQNWWEEMKNNRPGVEKAILREASGTGLTDIALILGILPIQQICAEYFATRATPATLLEAKHREKAAKLEAVGWSIADRSVASGSICIGHRYMEIRDAYLD